MLTCGRVKVETTSDCVPCLWFFIDSLLFSWSDFLGPKYCFLWFYYHTHTHTHLHFLYVEEERWQVGCLVLLYIHTPNSDLDLSANCFGEPVGPLVGGSTLKTRWFFQKNGERFFFFLLCMLLTTLDDWCLDADFCLKVRCVKISSLLTYRFVFCPWRVHLGKDQRMGNVPKLMCVLTFMEAG